MPTNGRKRTPRTAVRDLDFRPEAAASSGVEVLELADLRRRELDHSIYDLTRPDFHMLLLFTRGRGTHLIDFVPLDVRAGTLLHVRPKQVHAFRRGGRLEATLVVFRPEMLPPDEAPTGTNLLQPRAVLVPPADLARLRALCAALTLLGPGPSALDLDRVAARQLQVLWEAVRQLHENAEHGAAPAPADLVRRVRAFEASVLAHLVDHRPVAWHAARLGCAPRSLARACHRVLGAGPKAHLDRLAALEARRWLAHSDDSIERISDALGFSEPTNFTKFFVRTTGQTPRAFRRRVRRRTDGGR